MPRYPILLTSPLLVGIDSLSSCVCFEFQGWVKFKLPDIYRWVGIVGNGLFTQRNVRRHVFCFDLRVFYSAISAIQRMGLAYLSRCLSVVRSCWRKVPDMYSPFPVRSALQRGQKISTHIYIDAVSSAFLGIALNSWMHLLGGSGLLLKVECPARSWHIRVS